MSLSYLLRLLFISSAFFFLVHAIVGLVLRLASTKIIKFSHKFQPRGNARLLLFARLLPFGLASFAVLGLCVPSYLWLEPGSTSERVSSACLLAAFAGILVWCQSILRTIRAVLVTRKFTRACLKAGREQRLSGDSFPILVVDGDAPILAMAGVIRPRLVISRIILKSLSHDELGAAIRHERAHRNTADNLKRLLLLLSPELFPFVRISANLDHAWRTVSEWAADDAAVQADPARSLSLASALIRVAQMGAPPRMSPLCTALVAGDPNTADADLADRVNRLLHPAPAGSLSLKPWNTFTRVAAASSALTIMVMVLRPSTLQSVHQLLERVIR